ncbi:MAG TPA: hypothetical protein VEK75_05955, partial [Xanthobacteraceae bacterium]|nr:hypothetical protein [Xanthobacteraceae bacterium]
MHKQVWRGSNYEARRRDTPTPVARAIDLGGKAMRARLRYWWVLGMVLGGLAVAQAQPFPGKAITLVVSASPGGVTDFIARALGRRFTENIGQPVIVENKPGATNQIAA